MDERKRVHKKERIVVSEAFNPSARTPVTLDREDLDYIGKTIAEAGLRFAQEQDKQLMIIIIGIIREKLRTDPSFAIKLKKLLELDSIRLDRKKNTFIQELF